MKKPYCPFCGEEFYINVELPCGQHPNEEWFIVTHFCGDLIEIGVLQKGSEQLVDNLL